VGSQLSLADLEGTLVPAYLEQFYHTLLIWGLTSNLTDDIADKFGALASNLYLQRERERE
jgi:hypothetical protein